MSMTPEQIADQEEWTQDGEFSGADGRTIRCYDDVKLSRPIPVDGGVGTDVAEVPAGTIGTVLFYTTGSVGVAQLECYVGERGFTFGFEELARLSLHQRGEEKHSKEGSVG